MTEQEIAGLGPPFASYLGRYRGCFLQKRTMAHFDTYCRGLLSDLPRKSVEPLALEAGTAVRTLQEFLVTTRWDNGQARDLLQRQLAAAVAAIPADSVGTVGVVDETSCRKWGEHTPGVQRQYLGWVGKVDNGIVTVHVGVAKGRFQALLDAELYLPRSWDQDRARCRAAGIPDELRYRPKWRIALDQLTRLEGNGVTFDWLVFEEVVEGRVLVEEEARYARVIRHDSGRNWDELSYPTRSAASAVFSPSPVILYFPQTRIIQSLKQRAQGGECSGLSWARVAPQAARGNRRSAKVRIVSWSGRARRASFISAQDGTLQCLPLVLMRRTPGLVVPGTPGSVHQFHFLLRPRRYLQQAVQAQAQVEAAEIAVQVAHVLLPGPPDLLDVLVGLVDRPTVGHPLQDLLGRRGRVRAEEGEPAAVPLDQHHHDRPAGRQVAWNRLTRLVTRSPYWTHSTSCQPRVCPARLARLRRRSP
jgi:hypothetical protein